MQLLNIIYTEIGIEIEEQLIWIKLASNQRELNMCARIRRVYLLKEWEVS